MIRFLLNIYILVIVADAVLSYMPQYRNHEYVVFIRKLANYSLNPVRKFLPAELPFDISPVVVIILIRLVIELF